MKLLKISESVGQFLSADNDYKPIDQIKKEDLLRLVDRVLDDEDVEMDPFNDQTLRNQAHQVIYRSIVQKLSELQNRRQAFVDESARLFLEEYEKYRELGPEVQK